MRVRVIALLVGLMAMLAFPVHPAHADPTLTKCPTQKLSTALRAADAVYVGKVMSSKRVHKNFQTKVQVQWSYSGAPLSVTVPVRSGSGRCDLGRLTKGTTYLLVLTVDGGVYVAKGGGGTAPVTTKLRDRVDAILGEGQAVGEKRPQDPVEVEFTTVGSEAPSSFVHAALPGFAVVGVALIGWIVVRRLSTP